MNELIVNRVFISFDERHLEWLNSRSDHPIEDGYIFSRVFCGHDAFAAFLTSLNQEIPLEDALRKEWLRRYDASWFESHSLVMMFSDERSGTNRLTLKESTVFNRCVTLSLLRRRGLTMDMAYLFLFHERDGHDADTSAVRIENDLSSEAALF